MERIKMILALSEACKCHVGGVLHTHWWQLLQSANSVPLLTARQAGMGVCLHNTLQAHS